MGSWGPSHPSFPVDSGNPETSSCELHMGLYNRLGLVDSPGLNTIPTLNSKHPNPTYLPSNPSIPTFGTRRSRLEEVGRPTLPSREEPGKKLV